MLLYPYDTTQNKILSDPLNILNQNILKTWISAALVLLFFGVVKRGWGASQNNNVQHRKIPKSQADTCFSYSPTQVK